MNNVLYSGETHNISHSRHRQHWLKLDEEGRSCIEGYIGKVRGKHVLQLCYSEWRLCDVMMLYRHIAWRHIRAIRFEKLFNVLCIHATLKCDEDDDLGDGSDEINGDWHVYGVMTPRPHDVARPHIIQHYVMMLWNFLCIHLTLECDRDDDCWDRLYEKMCLYLLLLWRNGITTLLKILSDVAPFSHTETCHNMQCDATQFKCTGPEEQRCIPSQWVCDGENDCADNSDEASCPGRYPPPPKKKKKNKKWTKEGFSLCAFPDQLKSTQNVKKIFFFLSLFPSLFLCLFLRFFVCFFNSFSLSVYILAFFWHKTLKKV